MTFSIYSKNLINLLIIMKSRNNRRNFCNNDNSSLIGFVLDFSNVNFLECV